MDSSILQLFAVEEILERISRKRLTGCFHAFVTKEAAVVFFKEGIIVAAVKGKTEGEEVLKQILDWKGARYVWQSEAASLSMPASAPLQINFREFLTKNRPAGPTTTTGGMPIISISSKGKSTGPLPSATGSLSSTGTVDMTATKTINSTAAERFAHEDALLHKYKFWLISVEQKDERHRLARVNTLVGRSPACALAISHPSISRQHCILQITDRGLHVKDLETTNGTRVNGIVMKEGYINVGDKLTIGHLNYRLEKE